MTEYESEACEAILKHSFRNLQLLEKALTHSSSKSSTAESNERMEFLGDAILGMIISEYLYQNFPDSSEGDLTRIKSVVVSRTILAQSAKVLQLGDFIRVGRGLGQRKLPRSVLANVFEAVIAAIYEDQGLDAARTFILNNLREQIQTVVQDEHEKNYKSLLQQYAQRELAATPTYRVISQKGPDHSKEFEVVVVINDLEYVTGWGRSKKEAEQRAAEQTLKQLLDQCEGNGGSPPNHPTV
ncbi:MAG: ribonuclease III [Planctomycetes bacterium]|nr:ribonuclease III [Planctomycetota bacterium]